jgi:hypothetical protein
MCCTRKIGYLTAAVRCLNSCSAVVRWFLRCQLVLSRLCRQKLTIVCLAAICLMSEIADVCRAQSVLTYHGSSDRHGHFIVPSLNWQRARSLHLDPSFQPRFSGHVYAQPLYWQPPGSSTAMLIVATEDDSVHAIDAESGRRSGRRPWVDRSSSRHNLAGTSTPWGSPAPQ